MCGIVGYTGSRPVIDVLMKGLSRLEYRGYDSAGVAFFQGHQIEILKSEGKLENVSKLLAGSEKKFAGAVCGIGHTRWATHGKPTTQNAHPHRTDHVVLVHNGIIENYQEIKAELLSRGHRPKSETDSELFGFLVLEEMGKDRPLLASVMKAFRRLEGACSVVVMSDREPGIVVGIRNGSPLVAARDPQGGAILASDAQPILEYTNRVVFMENGDVAYGTPTGIEFYNFATGEKVSREETQLDWSVDKIDKGGFPHYMLKEIHEQPAALVDTLNSILDRAKTDPFPLAKQPGVDLLTQARELVIVACGSSFISASLGRYWIERFARVPVRVELASEFRYSNPVVNDGSIIVGISQSGETADTLAVIREMKLKKIPTLAITNVRGSTIAREATACFFTSAGPEIGVAATKSFTTQMLTLILWAGAMAIARGQGVREMDALFHEVVKLPHLLASYLENSDFKAMDEIKRAARDLEKAKGFFFIGRGYSYPIALEGALKLKEIAYVHAEGYAAGELKHGPIAMIDENMVVVVLAPKDSWRDKTVSNLEEVKARGARILSVGAASDHHLRELSDYWIPLPELKEPSLLPFAMTLVVQLLSYEIAVLHGTDVDKPRNLAKSVTVE